MGIDINSLISLVGKDNVYKDYSLKNLTTFCSGGNAEYFVTPNKIDQLKNLVLYLKNNGVNYFVLGNGSNVLVSDKGYKGVLISTLNLTNVTLSGSLAVCDCGVKISSLLTQMENNSLSGLEFLVGVPATVGGATCMNAGAFGKNISDVIKYVVTENGVYSKKECSFDYRSSRFLNNETILKVCFNLKPCELDEIYEKLKSFKSFRKNPKGKTCGSVFKNDGYFAGKVIDEAGLKGFKIGLAKVSETHANFIINNGESSQDIFNLIKKIKEEVFNKKQIELKEEVIYLGDFT